MWKKLKRIFWQGRGIFIAAPSVTVLVIALRSAGLLQMLELAAFDQLFRIRPKQPTQDRIVIVDITEADVRNVKRWPMSDGDLVKLLENIKAQKPRAIGLDLYRDLAVEYRDLPLKPGHQELVKLFKTTPNLIGIRKVAGKDQSEAVAAPPDLKYPDQVGANNLFLDADGKVRRFYFSLRTPEKDLLDGLGPVLAMKYLEREGITPQLLDEKQLKYKLGKSIYVPFNGSDGGYIRATDSGYQVLLNYQGSAGTFPRISMTEVMENRIPPNLMRDRIILIGVSAQSLNDLHYTPYSSNLLGIPERMPGVEIHANITSQILSSAIDGRPMIKTWSEPLEWLFIFAASALGATLSWTQRDRGATDKSSPILSTSLILASGSLFGSCYLAFLNGWWIPLVPPFLALTGSALAITAYIARSAGEIRKTFGRYLTAEVVSNLLETPEGLKLGGERKKVTIMMTDLRGFSAVSERLAPEDVVTFLNIYLGAMADIITQYNGTIDEFIGDAILVIFGAPTERSDDAQRAVACAIAMQLGMDAVNEQIKHLDMPKLEMGIGINTGEVVVGNIGSDKRAKYGIVGSHVNLTGRIESYTVGGQILISEYTFKEAGNIFRIDGEMQVAPKGIKQTITLYDIGGVDGNYNIYLPSKQEIYYPLNEPISLEFTILEGKHVVGTVFQGSLVKLSETCAELMSLQPLAALNNLKIDLLIGKDKSERMGDLYAKVLNESEDNVNGVYIRFTAVPPNIAALLSEQMAQIKK